MNDKYVAAPPRQTNSCMTYALIAFVFLMMVRQDTMYVTVVVHHQNSKDPKLAMAHDLED